jgi:hypothetical protein
MSSAGLPADGLSAFVRSLLAWWCLTVRAELLVPSRPGISDAQYGGRQARPKPCVKSELKSEYVMTGVFCS